jgi:hypothetical protein
MGDVNRIVGGNIANSGYDHLRLDVPHTALLPDGSELRLPAGTKLFMAVGYTQVGGAAEKAPRGGSPGSAVHLGADAARAAMADPKAFAAGIAEAITGAIEPEASAFRTAGTIKPPHIPILARLLGLDSSYVETMISMPEGRRDARARANDLLRTCHGSVATLAERLRCDVNELRELLAWLGAI